MLIGEVQLTSWVVFPRDSIFEHSISALKLEYKYQNVENITCIQIEWALMWYQKNNKVDLKRIWKTKIVTVNGKKRNAKIRLLY